MLARPRNESPDAIEHRSAAAAAVQEKGAYLPATDLAAARYSRVRTAGSNLPSRSARDPVRLGTGEIVLRARHLPRRERGLELRRVAVRRHHMTRPLAQDEQPREERRVARLHTEAQGGGARLSHEPHESRSNPHPAVLRVDQDLGAVLNG